MIMKTQFENPRTHKSATPSIPHSHPRPGGRPLYALRRGLGFWELAFEGEPAVLKHEQGIYYVAYLLANSPEEPIHGLALALKTKALYGKTDGVSFVVDPASGRTVAVESDATLQQRSLGLDEAERVWALRREQHELEAILDDEDQIEPVRLEVARELKALYEHQTGSHWRARDAAQRAADSVGKAIKRFYHHLAGALDAGGNPHPVLGPFAEHLRAHLLVPSGRCCARGGPRPDETLAGCFSYRPPAGVIWTV